MLRYFKQLLKKHLPPKKFQAWRQLYVKIAARFQGGGLERLAQLHGTDKIFGHDYIEVYEHHFQKFRKLPVNFLEIGVGGYDESIHACSGATERLLPTKRSFWFFRESKFI